MSMIAEELSMARRARIAEAAARLQEIAELMSRPDVVTDNRQLQALGREQNLLAPIVERGNALMDLERAIRENESLLSDADDEMRALAEEELRDLQVRRDALHDELLELL